MAFNARSSAPHDSYVVTHWRGGDQLVFGSLAADPGRGFVRLEGGEGKPAFFTTPEGAGALRLVSHNGDYSWKFRTSNGALALLYAGISGDVDVPPSFEFLGRRLDPAKLGPIGSRGAAVPVDLGDWKSHRPVVVLVEQTPDRHGSFGNGWKVDGYLPGFTTPRVASEWQSKPGRPFLQSAYGLQQPLRGPDGNNYSIDANGQRLVRVGGTTPAATLKFFKLGDCTTWPGSNGASYRACGTSITVHRAHRAARTIYRQRPNTFEADDVWAFLQPSPNGRWLLLEYANETCSYFTLAGFMPARGGSFTQIFPGSSTNAEAFGWLPDNTALVFGAPQSCGGNGPEGIYQVRPETASSASTYQLVFPREAEATTWGFKH